MAKKNFSKLSPDEVTALTGADLDEYNAWADEQASKTKKPTPESIGAAYFKSNPMFHEDSVIVCEDGTVFAGSIKGQNSADNYVKDKTGANGQMSYTVIQR